MSTRDLYLDLDARDPLAHRRDLFAIPDGVVYLDGNSLGAQLASIPDAAGDVLGEWRYDLIGGWTERDWWALPSRLGDRLGRLLLGAGEGQVIVSDTVTVNLFKVLHAALGLRPERMTLLVEESSFPTDRYVVDAVAMQTGREVRVIPRGDRVADHVDESVAAAVLNHVDFRTAEILDMPSTTGAVQRAGALAIWDLSHSAGVLPISLDYSQADFAIGCTYKYLNGGPGAPAYLYAAARLVDSVANPIPGWIGHRAPFEMTSGYEPTRGVRRFLTGTHSVIALRLVAAALDAYEGVPIDAIRTKSMVLTSAFVDLVDERCAGLGYEVVSPREAERRGSQVTLHHPEAPDVFDRVVAEGVRGDFRPPSLLRFGFAPLYNSYADVWDAVEVMRTVASA